MNAAIYIVMHKKPPSQIRIGLRGEGRLATTFNEPKTVLARSFFWTKQKGIVKAVHNVLLYALLDCFLVRCISVLMRPVVPCLCTLLDYSLDQLIYFYFHSITPFGK